jgi:hypothetical protein
VRALILVLALTACDAERASSSYVVTFTARADAPLAGVEVSVKDGAVLGRTGEDGTLRVTLTGPEGTVLPLRVSCPPGYRTPPPPDLTLRRFTGLDPKAAERGLEVSLSCPPAQRMAALVIKTGRAGLPVLAQGREVARTDARGYAHALVAVAPDTSFQVVIDTRGEPRLRPASPMSIVSIKDADEIVVIDRPFTLPEVTPPPAPTPAELARAKAEADKKKKKPRPRPRPRKPKPPERKGPVKLD